jgi:LysR family transcriptional regulator, low CO2-responsive transcriptional regulator
MAITLTQLRAFLAVVRTGSVRAASEELVVTQPSVSAALSALSREVGVELTERAGRGIRLSAAGAAFAPYAADVVGLLESGTRAAHEASDRGTRELRVAAVTTAAERILPPLLPGFARRAPDVRIAVEVGNRDLVFRRLADHEADVAIAGRAPRGSTLVSEPFLENALAMIAPADDPLALRNEVAPDELVDRTWLLREPGSGTRRLNEVFLARHGLRPRLLTLGSNVAIVEGVRAGLGISVVSRVAVALELDAGVLATLPVAGLPDRRWYAHRSAVGPVRPAVAEWLDYVCGADAHDALLAAQHGESEISAA